MIKGLVRKVVTWALKDKSAVTTEFGARNLTGMIREGSVPVITVWPISNGYLIVNGYNPMMMNDPTIIYVKDIAEIGEQIATMQARVAIGVPSTVKLRPTFNIGSP
jgi:hypothetical protein